MEDMVRCGLCGNLVAEEFAIMARGFEPVCSEYCHDLWDTRYDAKFNTGQNNIDKVNNNV